MKKNEILPLKIDNLSSPFNFPVQKSERHPFWVSRRGCLKDVSDLNPLLIRVH